MPEPGTGHATIAELRAADAALAGRPGMSDADIVGIYERMRHDGKTYAQACTLQFAGRPAKQVPAAAVQTAWQAQITAWAAASKPPFPVRR